MGTRTWRLRAVAVLAAAATGFGGAAAVDAVSGPALAEAADFGPGDGLTRYLVTAASGAATPDLVATLAGVPGVDSAQPLADGGALVATADAGPDRLRRVPGVADVELSPQVPVLVGNTDPYSAAYGWNLENTGSNTYQQAATEDADMDATDGWRASTGKGVVIALVDTGFDSDHPDLRGSLWTNPAESCGSTDIDGNGLAGDCHGWNFATNSADVDNGANGTHGTSVAGVLGARNGNGLGSAGVAPEVTIMPLVIGGGESVDVNLGAQAIRYAADHGATVVNASWGGRFSGAPLDALRSAVAYAAGKGVLVVAAAGNDAADRDGSILYPASLPDATVVTVGSSTAVDSLSDTSAYGATTVDLFAPGNKVATTWNDGGYRSVSGTSIAAPHVAAALALYRATMPTATALELKQALLDDVQPLPAFAGTSVTGGRLTLTPLAPVAAEPVRYRFTGTSGPVGTLSPHIAATGPDGDGEYAVTLHLGMEHDDEVWALADTAVTLGGITLRTDDAGQVSFPLGHRSTVDGLDLAPTVGLAEGRYALSALLTRDGVALGGRSAAPLLVGDVAPTPVTPPRLTSAPQPTAAPTGSATRPPASPTATATATATATTTPTTPRATGTSPAGATGTTTSSAPATGTATPRTSAQATSSAPSTRTTGSLPATPTGSGTPGASPTSTTPGTGTSTPSATSTSSTSRAATTTGATTTGPRPAGTPTSSSSAPAGGTTFPEVGPFGLTGLSPTVVSTAGGEQVTVTGRNVPPGARVRIGDSAAATVVRSTSTSVVFLAPPVVAGGYDVHVYDATGRVEAVLPGALTYRAPAAGGTTTSPASASTTPKTTPTTTPTTTPVPGSSGPGSTAPGTAVGPDGQRLVRSAVFGSLGPWFWATDCSRGCGGVPL